MAVVYELDFFPFNSYSLRIFQEGLVTWNMLLLSPGGIKYQYV